MFVLDAAWHVGSKTIWIALTRRKLLRAGSRGGGGDWKCSWEVWFLTEDSKTVSYADTAIDLVFAGRYLTAGDIDVSCFNGPCLA